MRILSNKKGGRVVLHFTANGSANLIGNSSVSQIAIGDEVVTSAHITQIWCGSASGNGDYWTVKRGSNTVAVLDSTIAIDFAGLGAGLTLDATANISANLVGTAGFLMVELKKESGIGSQG